jgi:IS4 transposase
MFHGMNTQIVLEYEWPYLRSFLPDEATLERSAYEHGALRRKRNVANADGLLRLALAYGFCGLTLRQTAAWAQVAGVADISDVALLKRLRGASDWLGHLLALKLAERAHPPPAAPRNFSLRIVDATTISRPGSAGTDWRIHLEFDVARWRIRAAELTDERGGESLTRFEWRPQELVLADRGYSHRQGFWHVRQAQAHFIVRLNWQTVPLQDEAGAPWDLFTFLRNLPDAAPGEQAVQTAPDRTRRIPALPVRVAAVRKSEAAAAQARKKILQAHSRKGHAVDPRTLEAAGYVFVLCSLPRETLDAAAALELYRFRWQIELAFKRLKSLLDLGELPARDRELARSFLHAKLLAALLLDDLTDRFLAFFPWGYRLARTTPVPLAHPASPARRAELRDDRPHAP